MAAGGSRKTHSKSRLGCKPCKRRRIKGQCDGSGPSCGKCQKRKVQCEYADLISPATEPVSRQYNSSISIIRLPDPLSFASTSDPFQPYELRLLHHWVTNTSLVVGLNRGRERDRIWQAVVPQLAQTSAFLLNIILATSAAHLANCDLRSDKETHRYRCLALHHHIRATSDFRHALSNEHERLPSESAILPFGILAMFTTLALLPASSISISGAEGQPTELDGFVHWLIFTRHSIAFALSWLKSGARVHETSGLVNHLHGAPGNIPKRLTPTDDLNPGLLSSLDQLTSLVTASSSTSLSLNDAETLILAIAQTKLWFRLVPLRPQVTSYLVLWVGSMSEAFLSLVRQKCPLALALTAHWIVPLYHAPKIWFIAHWPRRTITAIAYELAVAGVSESIEWVIGEVSGR